MDEFEITSEPEIVDKDSLPLFLSVSLGAAVTFLLGLFLPLLSFLAGSLVAVFYYVKSNKVSVSFWHSVRIGYLAAFLGAVLLVVAFDIVYYNQFGSELPISKEDVILELEKQGKEDQIALIEEGYPEKLTVGLVVVANIMLLFVMGVFAFLASLIGGWIGSKRFRYGPLAQ